MMRQLCEACEFFAPAWSHTGKPTWGQCLKLVEGKGSGTTEKSRPLFTWADNQCDDFQRQESSVLGR
jgi:hypothetical protein